MFCKRGKRVVDICEQNAPPRKMLSIAVDKELKVAGQALSAEEAQRVAVRYVQLAREQIRQSCVTTPLM